MTLLSLLASNNSCFVLYDSDTQSLFEKEFLPANVHFFIVPALVQSTTPEIATWKANTVKSLNACLYIDTDEHAVSQARALGIPACYYSL